MARTSRRTFRDLITRSPMRRGSSARGKATFARRLALEPLELRQLLSVNPIISEILADNGVGITDSSGNHSDWLEICNPNSQQAIDLTGWKLQYDTGGSAKTWTFPSMSLGPNESRVIFCTSGLSQTDPTQELHANFNLSKSGKYLALLDNNNNVVQSFSPTFPSLDTDVSYGTGQAVTETTLVDTGATARYYAPTSNSLGSTWTQPGFSDTGWASGPTGLGYVSMVPGFAVTEYKSNLSSVSSVAQAQSVIDTVSNQSWTASETASVVNYMNTGGGGEFSSGDRTFPGMSIGTEVDCFVTQATGRVHIPSAGNWTFGVNSDDGFTCTVNGQTFAYDGLRGPGDSFGTVTFAAAGDYDLSLVGLPELRRRRFGTFCRFRDKNDFRFHLPPGGRHGQRRSVGAEHSGHGNREQLGLRQLRGDERASGHAGRQQHLVVRANRLRRGQPGVAAEPDAQDAIRRRIRGVSQRRRSGAAKRPGHGRLELAGGRRTHQRRSSHDVRDLRRDLVSQLGHDRPPHGHRQRAGDSSDEIVAQRRRHARGAGAVADRHHAVGRPFLCHSHAGHGQHDRHLAARHRL